jgi:hypothetical protein
MSSNIPSFEHDLSDKWGLISLLFKQLKKYIVCDIFHNLGLSMLQQNVQVAHFMAGENCIKECFLFVIYSGELIISGIAAGRPNCSFVETKNIPH